MSSVRRSETVHIWKKKTAEGRRDGGAATDAQLRQFLAHGLMAPCRAGGRRPQATRLPLPYYTSTMRTVPHLDPWVRKPQTVQSVRESALASFSAVLSRIADGLLTPRLRVLVQIGRPPTAGLKRLRRD